MNRGSIGGPAEQEWMYISMDRLSSEEPRRYPDALLMISFSPGFMEIYNPLLCPAPSIFRPRACPCPGSRPSFCYDLRIVGR